MPSRSFHHKSRHGCLNCKQRRKRCDQRRPTCTGCARRKDICSYEHLLHPSAASLGPSMRSLATEWATIDPSVQAILSLQVSHIDASDVETIYHFHTKDHTSLDTMPGIYAVRHQNLVKEVSEYPYLLYGLITASALHAKSSMGSENQLQTLKDKATNFYQLALSTYRSRLDVIDEDTCHAIFAFSVILAALTFGLLHPATTSDHDDNQICIDGVISIFDLLLGAVAVAHESRAWIPETLAVEPLLMPIRASFSRHYKASSSRHYNPVENEAHQALDSLSLKIHSAHALELSTGREGVPTDISVIYDSAIPELRNVFFCLQKTEPNDILGVVGWPAFVGKSSVSLLKQRQNGSFCKLGWC